MSRPVLWRLLAAGQNVASGIWSVLVVDGGERDVRSRASE